MTGRVGGVDPATGVKGGDSLAGAVAHQDGPLSVLDAVFVRRAPFSPASAVAEAAAFFTQWGVPRIVGDRVAGEFVREAFREHGVEYEPTDRTKSEFYLEFLVLVNSGRARLLDHPDLLRELRALERRRGFGGRDRVDNWRGRDDVANAVAIAICLAADGARNNGLWFQRGPGFLAIGRGGTPQGPAPEPVATLTPVPSLDKIIREGEVSAELSRQREEDETKEAQGAIAAELKRQEKEDAEAAPAVRRLTPDERRMWRAPTGEAGWSTWGG